MERIADDMAAFGYAAEAVDQVRLKARLAEADEGFAVHPDNVRAVKLLLAMQTQWRMVALSTATAAVLIRTGLEYAALESTARLAGVVIEAGDFDRLQFMEHEALAAWREERNV